MYFCQYIDINNMLGRLSEALHSAADVLAPPPTSLQDFEYHWKQVKQFYATSTDLPKVHLIDTNIPNHLEQMLTILIQEDNAEARVNTTVPQKKECIEFLLNNNLLDLLADLAIMDSPPGATICVLKWTRRYLSCLVRPSLHHANVFQPIKKLISICNGSRPTPYEQEEVLFLSTVAGWVRKEPHLVHIFLSSHQHRITAAVKGANLSKLPIKNPLFDCDKIETNIRVAPYNIEIVPTENAKFSMSDTSLQEKCDCEEGERLILLTTLLTYFDSPDSTIVVRACEGALILASLPSLTLDCKAICNSLRVFSATVEQILCDLCAKVPEDMDTADIEDLNVSWGLLPRDLDSKHFVGRLQLKEFLSWLDYADCLMRECLLLAPILAQQIRESLLEKLIEPVMLDVNGPFMIVLVSKIIKQMHSPIFMEELSFWLVGNTSDENVPNDSLLTIVIENAQDNSDVLLATMQFIESILDNPNERVLEGMLFKYIKGRGYFDSSAHTIQTWSDEEEERDKRRGSIEGPIKSRTLAPNNILKVINNFLLLLPRQIMGETIGTCYEEYVQDASRHYQNWIRKSEKFNWPPEATFPDRNEDKTPESVSPSTSIGLPPSQLDRSRATKKGSQCNDSGISEERFYEGPLLHLLFNHVQNMASYAYEYNLAVIAILSKLSFLPHPYLHEILLNPEIPVSPGATTLWTSMSTLAYHLLLEIPRFDGFQKRIADTGKRLLSNPPLISESYDIIDPLFESIIVLEEFCKELAAIAFVKYHHATE